MSPLEQARACIDAASQERNHMMALCAVLIRKLGNEVVITNAEIESVTPMTAIKNYDKTDIGFKVSTYEMQPGPGHG